VSWIVEAQEKNDQTIDSPLLVPRSKALKKISLTKEEAKKAAEELRKSIAAKKAKEEKELEKLREQERIRSGKELLKAKKIEEELQVKRNLETRRIEKEEAKRAKAKILAKLEEDRIDRRRKLGLPEQLTEEEKVLERERVEKKAQLARVEAEKKAAAGLVVKPVKKVDELRKILVDIKKAATSGTPGRIGDAGSASLQETSPATVCFKTLLVYLGNVAKHPEEEKFRTIKLNNSAFQKRVDCVPGGRLFLETFGFSIQENERGERVLSLPRNAVDPVLLQMAGAEIDGALTNPFFGTL